MTKKIVLWYDNIKIPNCFYKDLVLEDFKIIKKLNNYEIDYSLKETSETLDKNNQNLYFIELNNVHLDYNFSSLISYNTKILLKNGLNLVFYYPTEGHELDNWFEKLYKRLLDYDLLDCKIFFIFGDRNFRKNYERFIADRKIPSFLTPLYLDFFVSDYYERVNFLNEDLDNNKDYDYLFYNGKLRPHRLLSVSEIAHRNIIDKGLISFTDSTHTGRSYNFKKCTEVLKKFNYCPDHIHNFIKNFKPMILDMPGNNFSQENINNTVLDHYKKSYFSIVSETNVTHRFITEKTYKPIANLHPFVYLAAPKMLHLLREKGFETFPEFFDESYDDEKDHIKRILMVINEVEKFTKLQKSEKQYKFDSIKDKLIYNKNYYIKLAKKSGKKEHLKIFEKIGNSSVC